VRFSSDLQETLFEKEYYTELSNVLTDNLNLVYVAFTRAISVLRVNIPGEQKENRMGTLIGRTVIDLYGQPEFAEAWNEEQQIFTFGTMPLVSGTSPAAVKPISEEWIFSDFSGKLKLRSGSDEFFEQTGSGDFRKNRGNILHSILSEIHRESEVETAWNKAMAAGWLLPGESEDILRKLKEMVSHPVAGEWFSGTWKILTENDLLTKEEIYRPDRIMLRDNQAVVVDYKTGDRRESHVRQVRRYAGLLRESGIPDVRGYLWYIRNNELLEV